MAAGKGILSLLFGKKKRSRRGSRKVTKSGKKRAPKKLGWAIKRGKYVARVYKFHGKKGRRYSNGHLVKKGKTIYRSKAAARAAIRRKSKKSKKTTKRRRRAGRRSSFGVGGSYMPLSSFMSSYPYSVNSSPPWQ